MNTLIVCHAGAGMGLGHLTRSLVVARFLSDELGATVRLLIQGDSVRRSDLDRFEHRFLCSDEDVSAVIMEQIRQTESQVVVLDLHPHRVPRDITDLLSTLRRDGHIVIAVDGLVDHRRNLDLLFIPAFRFLPPDLTPGDPPMLSGWDCFLLNVKHAPLEWKPGCRVLALAGGSDATALGETWPTLLNETLPATTELQWVTGPYARQPVLPPQPRFPLVNHQAPAGLDDLMVEANYAVTVYGVSFYELLSYGVPTVVFSPYGVKDDPELAGISEAGVALVARDELDATEKLRQLMADDRLASALSLRARQKMSVPGGQTFARAVAVILEQRRKLHTDETDQGGSGRNKLLV